MYIDAKNSDVTIWLAKFPSFVAEKILELDEEMTIGTIEIEKEGASGSKINLKLSSDMTQSGIPSTYTVDFTEIVNNMYVLKTDNKIAKIEGTINKEVNICPVVNKEYIDYKKMVSKKAKNRQLQTLSFRDVNITDKQGDGNQVDSLSKKRKKMLMDKKRERLERGEVMDIIFRAFESNESWTAKEIADFSGQPIAYINEILPEICFPNKKDQKNTWELKNEYKGRRS